MAQYELNVIDYWLIVKKRKYLILLAAGLVVPRMPQSSMRF